MTLSKVLVVVKRTAFEALRAPKKKSDAHLRRLVEAGHSSTERLRAAHEEHVESVAVVKEELKRRGITIVERRMVLREVVRGVDLVVAVGGDGTLLGASHFVHDDTPVLGVNSAPAFSVGFLTGCRAPTFARTLDALATGEMEPLQIHRLQCVIGRRRLLEPVLNDVLFCAENPALTSRYCLSTPEGEEEQRSSGIWIATAAGSTAAFRSAGGQPMPLDSETFGFAVREPYAPPGGHVRLKTGVFARNQSIAVECRIPEARLFVDGAYRQHRVAYGETASFRMHPERLHLVRPRSELVPAL